MDAETSLLVDFPKKGSHGQLHGANTNTAARAREEDGHAISPRGNRAQERLALRLVVPQGEGRRVTDRDDTLFPALAADLHLLRHAIEVGATQTLELGKAHPRRVEELEDGEVAHVDEAPLPRPHFRGLKEEIDLGSVEIAGKMSLELRRADGAGGIGVDELVPVHVAVEAPYRGQGARH